MAWMSLSMKEIFDFQYNYLLFGLSVSPGIFQRTINGVILQDFLLQLSRSEILPVRYSRLRRRSLAICWLTYATTSSSQGPYHSHQREEVSIRINISQILGFHQWLYSMVYMVKGDDIRLYVSQSCCSSSQPPEGCAIYLGFTRY